MLTKDRDKAFQSDYLKHTRATEDSITTALTSCAQSLGRLGAPTRGRFAYPVEERRTEENATLLREAESKLDAFWNMVNTPILKALGPVKKTAIHRFLAQSRPVQRTPAWIKPLKSKSPPGSQDLHIPLAELELERRNLTEHTTLKNEQTLKLKTKSKTRGVAIPGEAQVVIQEGPEQDIQENKPAFAVDARSLRVFKTIFFTPSISATPGEIKWVDFLHAMVSVGFEPEKLYGSVWHFTPVGLGLQGSIHFHEPHKEGKATGKIPYRVARRMGCRLTRRYRWDGSSFSLAEK